MVQVDVFWTYAIGASFAASAGRQLKSEPCTTRNPYFTKTLLFLSIFFAPSGVVLLWCFPGWETMFAGDRNLPGWLVLLFCMTNITQGMLGFWVAHQLIKAGKLFAAHMQWVVGYFLMFFILVHGWDGTGYERFLYSGTIEQWRAHVEIPMLRFIWSDVALTLYGFGIVMLPLMFRWMSGWMKDGYHLENLDPDLAGKVTTMDLVKTTNRLIFVWSLGSAIVCSILIHLLGWMWGIAVFLPIVAVLGFRSGGIFPKEIGRLTLDSCASRQEAPVAQEAI